MSHSHPRAASANDTHEAMTYSSLLRGVAAGLLLLPALAGCDLSTHPTRSSGAVEAIAIQGAATEVVVNRTLHLTATPRDNAGRVVLGHTISWTTSDSLVATVSEDGRVTGRRMGAATITAAADGRTATVELYVRDPNLVVIGNGGKFLAAKHP
jgi:hypothetical protein